MFLLEILLHVHPRFARLKSKDVSILMIRTGLAVILSAGLALLPGALLRAEEASPKFELRDGDRIALVGGTFIEREQHYGFLELAIQLAAPDKAIHVRNLGWSGDTVSATSRARFGNEKEGQAHLAKTLDLVQPTVILVCYGTNEAFEGKAGLASFRTGYTTLLESLEARTQRIVMITPPAMENMGAPLPDPAPYNEKLKLYQAAVKQLAYDRGHALVDLTKLTEIIFQEQTAEQSSPITDNGQHFTAEGYRTFGFLIAQHMGLKVPRGVSFDAADLGAETPVSIELPFPTDEKERYPGKIWLAIRGLQPDAHRVRIKDEQPLSAKGNSWSGGLPVPAGEIAEQIETLRQTIVRKNQLFFDRYRPQNETYLYLFRKHEQGNNAVEIPKFDPLIEAEDQKIFELKQPIVTTISIES